MTLVHAFVLEPGALRRKHPLPHVHPPQRLPQAPVLVRRRGPRGAVSVRAGLLQPGQQSHALGVQGLQGSARSQDHAWLARGLGGDDGRAGGGFDRAASGAGLPLVLAAGSPTGDDTAAKLRQQLLRRGDEHRHDLTEPVRLHHEL